MCVCVCVSVCVCVGGGGGGGEGEGGVLGLLWFKSKKYKDSVSLPNLIGNY